MKKYRAKPQPAKTHASDVRGPQPTGLPPHTTIAGMESPVDIQRELLVARASEEAIRKAEADTEWMMRQHAPAPERHIVLEDGTEVVVAPQYVDRR